MEAILCCISILVVPLSSWNVDTRTPIKFSGSKGSYFGFSVALHDNSRGDFALVSGTRANSTSEVRKVLHQPGVVYKCNITTTKCTEVTLEKTANKESTKGPPLHYVAKEDDMWLGVSLDVQSTGRGYILACGHLWKNQNYEKHYLVNGACYTIDREFNRSSYKALFPLIHRDKQVIHEMYYYAYGIAGISATFVESENTIDILIGAPGIYDWIGTVISYSIHEDERYAVVPIVPDPPTSEQLTPAAYIGYSVTTGKFFDVGHLQFVSGAPRDGENKGRVYIIASLHHNRRNTTVLQRLEGEQVGEYFGACVIGINVNGDAFTDLFIGSPFYSLPGLGDEGKVYVYMSNGLALQKHRELVGLKKPRSRFGTTIANIGDLNQDGFLDVAVGAPYEDGKGVIYIYHGKNNGLDEQYKQRIAAKDIGPNLSGFGISIAKGKDIDGNKYPDILVGSYASDNAILFRTRPLVKVYGNITFDPPQIDTNTSRCTWNFKSVPCFKVTFCLLFNGSHVPAKMDISTELTSARERDELQIRRYLENGTNLTSYIRQKVRLTREESHCYSNQAYVVGDSNDFITPIKLRLNFKLSHDVTKEKSFCKSCSMLHPGFPSTVTETVTFQIGCGHDGICDSDLALAVNVHGLSSGELVFGQDYIIVLSIELKNSKEPAYNTDVYVYIPPDVQIINQDNCENKQDYSDLTVIVCNAGNPLLSGNVAKFEIKLDTSRISTELDYFTLSVNATTASQESNPEDNDVVIEIPLKIIADMTIFGNSVVGQIILGKKHFEADEPIDIVHLYTVLKYLPGPINAVAVEFLIPTTTLDKDVKFLQLSSIKINEGNSRTSVPASCNFTTEGPKLSLYNAKSNPVRTRVHSIPIPKRKRSVDNGTGALVSTPLSEESGYILDCNNSICMTIYCTAGPFKDTNLAANFRIHSTVNSTDLKKILDKRNKIAIVTEGKVKIMDDRQNIQPVNLRPDETKVLTTIMYASLLPRKKVALWIIIVSIIVGILLLLLISLLLIKMGFFKRKKKQQMEKMMMRAELDRLNSFAGAEEDTIKKNGAKAS